ncbi:F-ATPase epsilon subunit [uncultured Roseburia sp.]|uniref:ATP synthase epsilon chain n=1 Tax=Brotonthovivens ammoniilytica TaxID=2981725 RepID=A0ABT2TN46_9FIRM|nr:ATP synthase F1 subunit epsilon [Brotonthovivens ammoniilytica]MCU6763611.1 ATP synthase F1 subunit epsilon [Brotonthovivens ammoniilytica]SCJ26867.1 F-ATPase epsilon subunit [uncultured Roseburia sp.]
METFELKIIACDKVFYNDRSNLLIVPALDGELAVLPHHENMVVAVKAGEIKFRNQQGEMVDVVNGIGFVHIMNNRVTVLVDTVERPEDIDVARAKAAEERAKERLRQKQSLQEYHRSQATLARAMARITAASKHKNV